MRMLNYSLLFSYFCYNHFKEEIFQHQLYYSKRSAMLYCI
jgi:hypothetical protein